MKIPSELLMSYNDLKNYTIEHTSEFTDDIIAHDGLFELVIPPYPNMAYYKPTIPLMGGWSGFTYTSDMLKLYIDYADFFAWAMSKPIFKRAVLVRIKGYELYEVYALEAIVRIACYEFFINPEPIIRIDKNA